MATGALLLVCSFCMAATDTPQVESREPIALEEVLVTAQRREEPLQAVPISASALSASQLDRAQITSLDALQYAVPNLTNAPSQTSGTSTSFSMRGQFVRDTTPTIDPAVSLYLDGVYIARMPGANLDLVDMQRVEVLRGPQGTLFGRNASGGAINLVPARPTFDREALVKAVFGDYGRANLSAVANVPSADHRYALRFAAMHAEHGGYGHNSLLDSDLNDDHRDFARVQWRFAPSSRLDLNLAMDYSSVRSGSQWRTLLWVSPDATALPLILGNPTDSLANYVNPMAQLIASDRAGSIATRVWGTAATLKLELMHFTLKSISSYRGLQAQALDSDQDGTPYDLGVVLYRRDSQHQLTQELQLYGTSPGRSVDWIAGIYLFGEAATFAQRFRVFVPTTTRWSENRPSGDTSNDSLAAYSQLVYALTQQVRITAGARYNEDGRQLVSRNARVEGGLESCQLDPAIRDQPGLCQATLPRRQFRFVPWTLGVDLRQSDDTLLYVKLSRGQRSGGYNLRGATLLDLSTFEPERTTSYELGAKSELFGHRLRVNLALFNSLLDDMQLLRSVAVTSGAPGTTLIQNAGKARIRGGELELTALLGPLRLTGNLGVTDAAFTELRSNVQEVTLESSFLDTPRTTASVAIDIPAVVPFGRFQLHADYGWRDAVTFEYDPSAHARQGAYGLLNVLVSIQPNSSHWELGLWARNLTNRRYLTRAFDSDFYTSATPGDPRTLGMSLTVRTAAK
jgi:iron complex outermembrane receptor protein